MFTGIIKGVGKIKRVKAGKEMLSVSVEAPKYFKFKIGESVAVSGICTTVISNKKNIFEADYMKETLNLTTAKNFKEGIIVNLEQSMKFGDSLDGHMVYGHVEGVGKIEKIVEIGQNKILSISVSKKILKNIFYKGSVAIDGVSLTVSKKTSNSFEVSLIPYTLKHTTLGKNKIGDKVNIETDSFFKYAKKKS